MSPEANEKVPTSASPGRGAWAAPEEIASIPASALPALLPRPQESPGKPSSGHTGERLRAVDGDEIGLVPLHVLLHPHRHRRDAVRADGRAEVPDHDAFL